MAFFQPRRASAVEVWGESRTFYCFVRGVPQEVTDPRDVSKFSNQRDILEEVTPEGKTNEQPRETPEDALIRRPLQSPEVSSAMTTADLPAAKPKALVKGKEPEKVSRKSKK